MRRRTEDRRGRPRFEIVGHLTGALEVVLRCPVRNVGLTGALLECAVPLAPWSVQRLTLDVDGQQTTVEVRVCHTRAAGVRDGETIYYIGVEFLSSAPSLMAAITERIRRSGHESDARGV